MATQRDKFKQQAVSNPQPPKPPVPKLPEVFIRRYPPDIQQALRQYNNEWEQFIKSTTVRESTTDTQENP